MAKTLAFLILLLISPAALAVTHNVGGNSGWTTGVNYDRWANGQTFSVNDTLVFTYGPSHTVDEVSQSDYTNCNTGNPITSDSNSPTTVTLTAPGTRYFICQTSNHCNLGMKLTVTVAAASTPGSPPAPPTSPGTPAAPGPASGGSPSQTSYPPPPPPPRSSASNLVAGTSLVMAGILGVIMG